MGIDLSKMRAKKAALDSNGGGDDNFWKPTEGQHQVRLVCPSSGDPFFEAYYHYSMGAEGRTTVLSPRTNGDPDPIAEWGTQLWNEGTEASKEAAKRFWPKMRVFAPVLVRGEEDKGIRWWGFSRTTYQALLDIVLDPDYGDITDPAEGTDVRVDYGKKAGQAFPSTDIRPMRKTSKLAKTDAEVNKLLTTLTEANELFTAATYEECEKLLSATLGDGEATDDGVGEEKFGNNSNSTKSGMESVTDIESAFDDLLAS